MAISYQQTDNPNDCADFLACSSGTISANTLNAQLIEGGTQGSVEQTADIPAGSSRLVTFLQTTGGVGATTWDAGNYVVRINVTTAQMDLTVTGVWVCRISDACAGLASVGSDTTLSTNIGGGGVFSWTIAGTEQAASATDDLYVIVRVANGHTMTSRTMGITPTELIDTPIAQPPVTGTAALDGTGDLVGTGTTVAAAPAAPTNLSADFA